MRLSTHGRAAWLLLALPALSLPAQAADSWRRVRSKNYLLVGNASESHIRAVAAQLEQFREVFAREFAAASLASPVPTTVIVFRSEGDYEPYKPRYQGRAADVVAYFQSGHDLNYITLSPSARKDSPYALIFHESVHCSSITTCAPRPPGSMRGWPSTSAPSSCCRRTRTASAA